MINSLTKIEPLNIIISLIVDLPGILNLILTAPLLKYDEGLSSFFSPENLPLRLSAPDERGVHLSAWGEKGK